MNSYSKNDSDLMVLLLIFEIFNYLIICDLKVVEVDVEWKVFEFFKCYGFKYLKLKLVLV